MDAMPPQNSLSGPGFIAELAGYLTACGCARAAAIVRAIAAGSTVQSQRAALAALTQMERACLAVASAEANGVLVEPPVPLQAGAAEYAHEVCAGLLLECITLDIELAQVQFPRVTSRIREVAAPLH